MPSFGGQVGAAVQEAREQVAALPGCARYGNHLQQLRQ